MPVNENWYVSSFSEDLLEGELDPIANEKVSHLAHYVYYFSENIILEAVAKTDRLELSEPHSCTLKAIVDLSASRVLRVPSVFFFLTFCTGQIWLSS